MILNKDQQKEFEEKVKPVIEFLNNNCHPHSHVTIDCDHAELSEGICVFSTLEYIKG